jgi:hypothetical protein
MEKRGLNKVDLIFEKIDPKEIKSFMESQGGFETADSRTI